MNWFVSINKTFLGMSPKGWLNFLFFRWFGWRLGAAYYDLSELRPALWWCFVRHPSRRWTKGPGYLR